MPPSSIPSTGKWEVSVTDLSVGIQGALVLRREGQGVPRKKGCSCRVGKWRRWPESQSSL